MRTFPLLALLGFALSSVAHASAPRVIEVFVDKGDHFLRAGRNQGLGIGAQVVILGERIGDTEERRRIGVATVMEVWETLARVNPDRASLAAGELTLALLPEPPSTPPEPQAEPQLESPAALERTPFVRRGSVYLENLGFVFLGPMAGVEFGHEHVSTSIYVHMLSWGALARGMFSGPAVTFPQAYGAGLRGRYYPRGDLAGPHIGLLVEYLEAHQHYRLEGFAAILRYVVPVAMAGYRFDLGSVYLDVTGGLGYAARFNASFRTLANGVPVSVKGYPETSSVYGSLGLEFGLFF